MFSFLFSQDKLLKKQSSFPLFDLHKHVQDFSQRMIQNKINELNKKNKYKKIFYESSCYEKNTNELYSDLNLDKLDKLDQYNCRYEVNDVSIYMYLFPLGFFLLSKYLGKQS